MWEDGIKSVPADVWCDYEQRRAVISTEEPTARSGEISKTG